MSDKPRIDLPEFPELRIALPDLPDMALRSFERHVADLLRRLTAKLAAHGAPLTGGLLGGHFGYGAEFVGEVFEMHPFYWGDCTCGYDARESEWSDAHKHAAHCYQADLDAIRWPGGESANGYVSPTTEQYRVLCTKHGVDWNDGKGCAVHCDCGHEEEWQAWAASNTHHVACPIVRPNFKCGEVEVRWYKYIGRSMEIVGEPEGVIDAVKRAMASVEGAS